MIPARFKIVVAVVGLLIFQAALGYAAWTVAQIEGTPDWVGVSLMSLSRLTLIGIASLLAIYIIAKFGGRILSFLGGTLKDALESPPEPEPKPKPKSVEKTKPELDPKQAATKKIVRKLSTVVEQLDRKGEYASNLVALAEEETAALVDLVKKFATEATNLVKAIKTFEEAIAAVHAGDQKSIAAAAGGIRDAHLRSLLLLPFGEGDEAYWAYVMATLATQSANAERWRQDYSNGAVSLMGQVSELMVGLRGARAHIEVTEASRPLLQAITNLATVKKTLQISADEQADVRRLLKPQDEYVNE